MSDVAVEDLQKLVETWRSLSESRSDTAASAELSACADDLEGVVGRHD